MNRYSVLLERHVVKLFDLSKNFDFGRMSEADYDRMEEHYNNVHRGSVMTMFNRLTWEEQIHFCVYVKLPWLEKKLDEEQLASLRIMM